MRPAEFRPSLRRTVLALVALFATGCPLTTFEIDGDAGNGGDGGSAGMHAGAGGDSSSGAGTGSVGGSTNNSLPMPKDDSYVILQGEELTRLPAAGVLANDSPSGLHVVGYSEMDGERPPGFDASFSIGDDGEFHFTPPRGFFGLYRIKYTVQNAALLTAEATIVVRVIPTDIALDTVIEGVGGFVLSGSPGAALGTALSGAGDVNGDGLDDFLVGAPASSDGAGSAYLVFGKTDFDAIDLRILPSRTSEQRFVSFTGGRFDALGTSVSGLGDIDGDGVRDLVLGANGGTGRAYVVFGDGLSGGVDLLTAPTYTLSGDAANVDVGHVVSGVGDVNGDGTPDVLVSARNLDYGWIHVVFGNNVTRNASAPVAQAAGLHLRGARPLDAFPLAAASAGDVDVDGFDEVFVASESAFTLLLGGTSYPADAGEPGADGSSGGWSLLRGGPSLGAAVTSAGDVNGDDEVDVAYCDGVLYCRVVFGPPSTLASGWRIAGSSAESSALFASGGGDVDADGLSDVLFADDREAFVVYGKRSGHTDVNVTSLGASGYSIQAASDGTITSVSMLGDVNGDGISDYAVGDATADDGAGRVVVVFGVASE